MVNTYLRGEKLYGDDFSLEQMEQWFRDEADDYFTLVPERHAGSYEYHALNCYHGFDHLPPGRNFASVLGLGGAFGDELRPILGRCQKVTILEPADGFVTPGFSYVKPQANGRLPFEDASFDLITCLSVLHHIPNVSTVINELARCLIPDGYLLLREPVVSMGDWSRPRPGLTKHERGIPLRVLRKMLSAAGLMVEREANFGFPSTPRLRYLMRGPVYNSRLVVRLDAMLCCLPFWSTAYHPRTWPERLRPSAVFCVLRRGRTDRQVGTDARGPKRERKQS